MRILLALDHSRYSAGVPDALIAQTRGENAEVRLVHVIEPFPVDLARKIGGKESPDFIGARMQQRETAKKMLEQFTKKLWSAGFKSTYVIKEGDPRSAVLREAEAWGADLIMVGSHGRTSLERFLIGSVSEAVARHAGCSVQIVRPHRAR